MEKASLKVSYNALPNRLSDFHAVKSWYLTQWPKLRFFGWTLIKYLDIIDDGEHQNDDKLCEHEEVPKLSSRSTHRKRQRGEGEIELRNVNISPWN